MPAFAGVWRHRVKGRQAWRSNCRNIRLAGNGPACAFRRQVRFTFENGHLDWPALRLLCAQKPPFRNIMALQPLITHEHREPAGRGFVGESAICFGKAQLLARFVKRSIGDPSNSSRFGSIRSCCGWLARDLSITRGRSALELFLIRRGPALEIGSLFDAKN